MPKREESRAWKTLWVSQRWLSSANQHPSARTDKLRTARDAELVHSHQHTWASTRYEI